MNYEPVIGLEVHVQLKTKTKVFCACSTEFGADPNTQVCPVCLGFPGALPVLNSRALDFSIKVGIALNCRIPEKTKFDRKHYYYPDLPKNFQISQYDMPVASDGFLDIALEKSVKRVRVRRAHLEEDAGKLVHRDKESLIDYNRCGQPLLEIVTEPDIATPEEAYRYLATLKTIIQYLDVSDCDMEKGTLRCDANISLRLEGSSELGTKSEIKNLNSFKAVRDALSYEIRRQTEALENKESVVQETRLWDEKKGETISMRSKEEAKDYRYFPEPDLPTFAISKEQIARLKAEIPELPSAKTARFKAEYGLSENDAAFLVSSRQEAEYAEQCIKLYGTKQAKTVAKWLIGPLAQEANARRKDIAELGVPAAELIALITMVENQRLSHLAAKTALTVMIDSGSGAEQTVLEKNLAQVSDESGLNRFIEEAITENERSVNDYKAGRANALMFLVGQVMKKSKGKANPKIVQDMLKRRLSDAQ